MQYVQRLKDQYIQDWKGRCENNTKLKYYAKFKTTCEVEKYINLIDIGKFRKCLAPFRSSSHSFMVERGRPFGIARDFRDCPYCEGLPRTNITMSFCVHYIKIFALNIYLELILKTRTSINSID